MKLVIVALLVLSIPLTILFVRGGPGIEPVEKTVYEGLNKLANNEIKFVSPIDIKYLRSLKFKDVEMNIEEELERGSNYSRYLASYESDGNKIFGLLTLPDSENVDEKFPAVVFNHGYIPPAQYQTTQGYVAYVDYLARNGFVVFKIDLRGHGNSEGVPTGSYFSSGYTVDAINAMKALKSYESVDSERIGIWGHSMAGNLLLRAMLITDEFKAGVIWAGAVYSYKDFSEYGISDNSYVPRTRTPEEEEKLREERVSEASEEVRKLRTSPEEVDFNSDFWMGISLTSNINYLSSPVQIHHAIDDAVVDIGYSRDLAEVLEKNNKEYELVEHSGGGHNISSPYFEQAMQQTVDFFKENL